MIHSIYSQGSEEACLTKMRFLLLEDSAADVELISEKLTNSDLDYDLVVVETKAAFESLLESQKIDLVLADYSLPTFDGLSAIEIIQDKYPDIPCILVSGVLGEERAIDALKSGATDYVLKRRLERLVPAVTRALREQKERQALKIATARLEQSERRFRTSVETMVDPLFVLFGDREENSWIQDFKVCHLNKAACDYLFIEKEQAINRSLYKVVPALCQAKALKDNISFSRLLCDVVESGKPLEEEILLKSSDLANQHIVLDIRAAKLNDGLVLTWRDTTEKYRLATQREQLLVEAETARTKAEKDNRFKDNFLATVSHELRSPLSAITGWTHILQASQPKTDLTPRAVNAINRNATTLDNLIEDLLDAPRMIEGKLDFHAELVSIADLEAAIVDVVRSTEPFAQSQRVHLSYDDKTAIANSDTETKHQESKHQLLGDIARIQQAVRNLLTNAVKFTPAEGRVDITLEKHETHITISVHDTGIGISSEQLPQIFQRFWQAKLENSSSEQSSVPASKGLGLGLAITRHIVELHHGNIQAQSDGINQGSTFTIHLPFSSSIPIKPSIVETESQTGMQTDSLSAAEGFSSNSDIHSECPVSLQGLKVLVVEDYVDALEMYQVMLEICGARVRCATTLETAIVAFEEFEPDILISDLSLPQGSGYSIIRQIRARPADKGGNIPAIALTAFSEARYRTRALLAGFQVHIAKPVGLKDIINVVAEVSRSECERP